MQVKAAKAFPYAADGCTITDIAEGDTFEVTGQDVIDAFVRDKLIEPPKKAAAAPPAA